MASVLGWSVLQETTFTLSVPPPPTLNRSHVMLGHRDERSLQLLLALPLDKRSAISAEETSNLDFKTGAVWQPRVRQGHRSHDRSTGPKSRRLPSRPQVPKSTRAVDDAPTGPSLGSARSDTGKRRASRSTDEGWDPDYVGPDATTAGGCSGD
jgi:hypothetical protein